MRKPSADHHRVSQQCKRPVRRIALIGLSIWFSQSLRAEISPALMEATRPLLEGVPEVAVVRLRALLGSGLADEEWRAVAAKLSEAQIAARQPEDALVLLADSKLRDLASAKFWRAQAFASLHRWADALPLYEELAADQSSSLREAATLGAA